MLFLDAAIINATNFRLHIIRSDIRSRYFSSRYAGHVSAKVIVTRVKKRDWESDSQCHKHWKRGTKVGRMPRCVHIYVYANDAQNVADY